MSGRSDAGAPPAKRRERGADAEHAAREYLEAQGLETIAENFRTRHGEIDLVMRDGGVLVFVEVRSRSASGSIDPALTVDERKQQRLIRAGLVFLQQRRLHDRVPCRFDVVALSGEPARRKITWIRDAFQA
jgi:putative endonuclease